MLLLSVYMDKMTHHINCWSVLHILMSKPNEYVKMVLTNNTIESKNPNCVISQWWNTNGNTCLRVGLSKQRKLHTTTLEDSQVNNCSMCLPWTLTTVFNLGRHWSMALLISCCTHSVFEILQTHNCNSVGILLQSTPDSIIDGAYVRTVRQPDRKAR